MSTDKTPPAAVRIDVRIPAGTSAVLQVPAGSIVSGPGPAQSFARPGTYTISPRYEVQAS